MILVIMMISFYNYYKPSPGTGCNEREKTANIFISQWNFQCSKTDYNSNSVFIHRSVHCFQCFHIAHAHRRKLTKSLYKATESPSSRSNENYTKVTLCSPPPPHHHQHQQYHTQPLLLPLLIRSLIISSTAHCTFTTSDVFELYRFVVVVVQNRSARRSNKTE